MAFDVGGGGRAQKSCIGRVYKCMGWINRYGLPTCTSRASNLHVQWISLAFEFSVRTHAHSLNYSRESVPMALSAEPGRKRAYDRDLRWRIVYQRVAMNRSFVEIAASLNIAASTAHRTFHQFKLTGDVAASEAPTNKRYVTAQRKLGVHEELFVIGAVLANSSLYLLEVCQEVSNVFGFSVSPPTICRLLHSYGITRKRIRQVARDPTPCEVLLEPSVHSLTLIFLCSLMRQDQTIGLTSGSMAMHSEESHLSLGDHFKVMVRESMPLLASVLLE